MLDFAQVYFTRVSVKSFGAITCFVALLFLSMPTLADQRWPLEQVAPEALGSISGTVTNENGDPLPGIDVVVGRKGFYTADGPVVKTDRDGRYQVGRLVTDLYIVTFTDSDGLYRTMYSGSARNQQDAAEVPVTGNDVTGINVIMPLQTGLSGKLSTVDEFTEGSYEVTLYAKKDDSLDGDDWHAIDNVRLDIAETKYRFVNLDSGIYSVCARVSGYLGNESTEYESHRECYDDVVMGIEMASEIVIVSEGTAISGIDFEFGQSGQYAAITGTVTDPEGMPLAGVEVSARAYPAPFYHSVKAMTDEDGRYSLDSILPFSTTVFFELSDGIHVAQYFNDAHEAADAEELVVASGTTHNNINAQLERGGSMSGKLTWQGEPLLQDEGVEIRLYRERRNPYFSDKPYYSTFGFYDDVYDPETGLYTIGGLPAGTYLVSAMLELQVGSYYGGPYLLDAIPISIDYDATVSGIDISIAEGKYNGVIEGRVTADGNPLAGVRVQLFTSYYYSGRPAPPFGFPEFLDDIGAIISYAVTNDSGEYSIGGLTTGEYIIRFVDPNGDFATAVYASDSELRYLIKLEDGETISGIDGELLPGATISGAIRQMDGQPARFYSIKVEHRLGEEVEFIRERFATDENGYYEIKGLAAGHYTLTFSHPESYGATLLQLNVSVETGENLVAQDGVVGFGAPTDLPVVDEPSQEQSALTELLFMPLTTQ